mmetsp:Transcript_22800/g.41843  ORF Transcript_22800/g.41843 Transcript_22800/m.41843 type:complete len:206 (-) Transcript_22800:832-1449(-)
MRFHGVSRWMKLDCSNVQLGAVACVFNFTCVFHQVEELEGFVVVPAPFINVSVDCLSIAQPCQLIQSILSKLQKPTPYLIHPFNNILHNFYSTISRLLIKLPLQRSTSILIIIQRSIQKPPRFQSFLLPTATVQPLTSQVEWYVGGVRVGVVYRVVEVDGFGTAADVIGGFEDEDGFDTGVKECFGCADACPAGADDYGVISLGW